MANRVRVRVEGLAEMDRALGELPKATGRNVLRRVGRARLEPIIEDAAKRAPRLFGNLNDSITVSTKRPRRHRKESEVEVYGGPTSLPQAHLQEFGTRHHGPQPFMRPAWDAGKDELLEGLAEDLANEIEKAAQRIARKQARLIAKAGG
ncbi:MAG: HK97-gp10 family putative phage morphogenesis protein [Pseudomonadota bacterium]|jgi:HK97 gp10 family phage protein